MRPFPSAEAAGHTDYRALARRLGRGRLKERILKQAGLWARETHQASGAFVVERFLPVDRLIEFFLTVSLLKGVGRRNALDVGIVHHDLMIKGLPREFDGFRLLQLTDLHCDLDPALVDVVIGRLRSVECDVIALTGDYHNKIGAECDISLDLMSRLIAEFRAPAFAILGNHDFIEQVAFLEGAGLPLLLNEAISIERGGRRLWLCGVDDPHFFRTDDLSRTRTGIGPGEASILLSHSPEPYLEAEALGFGAMLCGHTHGGQFCLPGGIPILQNMRGPRRLLSGPWRQGDLSGYTSRGTGSCGVFARFFCPPEITLHTLRPLV